MYEEGRGVKRDYVASQARRQSSTDLSPQSTLLCRAHNLSSSELVGQFEYDDAFALARLAFNPHVKQNG
jgi:hypothetical protein